MQAINSMAAGFEIGQVIQLAITPVFTVAAIAGLLAVLSTRLGRIIDRARIIESRIPHARTDEQRQLLSAEAASSWFRIRVIHRAIQLSVSGALMICLVIVALFVGQFVSVNLSTLIATLFVLAMLSIIAGLICLLVEIGHATRRMRQGIEAALEESGSEKPPSTPAQSNFSNLSEYRTNPDEQ